MERTSYSLKTLHSGLVAGFAAFVLALSFATVNATSAFADESAADTTGSVAAASAASGESSAAATEAGAGESAAIMVAGELAATTVAASTDSSTTTGAAEAAAGATESDTNTPATSADGSASTDVDASTDAADAVGSTTDSTAGTTDGSMGSTATETTSATETATGDTTTDAATPVDAAATADATAAAAATDAATTAVTAASATTVVTTTAAAATAAKVSTATAKSGWFTIETALDGSLVLQAKSNKAKKGTKLVLAKEGYATGQAFQLEKLKSGYYRIFIGTGKGSRLYVSSKGSVSVSLKATGKNGMFKLVKTSGTYRFINLATGRALAISGSNAKSGVTITTKKSSSSDKTQRFVLVTRDGILKSGIYNLNSALSGKRALSTQSSSTKEGAKAALQNATDSKGQRWLIQKVSGKQNVYTIDNVATGYRLTASSGNTATMKKVSGSSSAQRWKVIGINGNLIFQNVKTGKVLQPSKGKSSAGTVVSCVKKSEAKSKQWSFTHLASTGANSNKTTYDVLGFSVKQMAQWQKSNNPYIKSYTVSYLMSVLDPNNGSKYKFVDLTETTGVDASALNAFIKTTGSKGKLAGLGSTFVSAAKTYGLNETYLLAHAILESDWGRSNLAMGYKYEGGYIDGKYYKKGTYYNFFGIGAYDSSPLSGGRKAAIINGWNTPAKAVTGAAKWIATYYVHASKYAQTTLYSMKWDLERTKAISGYGWHQYATSLTWADSIGNIMGQIYSKVGKTMGFAFIIPKYKS